MNMFASQTMGTSIKYILCLSMLIIKLSLIHGYDSKTNFMKIEDLDKQLKIVIKELHEEKEKSVNLEKQLSALKDESKGTPSSYKDQKKEFETVPTYSKKQLFIAFHDEKKQRKRFETEMKNTLMDQREHMENKISTLKDFCSSHIDTKIKTFEDKLLHSVTAPIDKAVNNLRLESEQQKTTLLRHDAVLVSLNDALVEVQSSIVDICHDKGWSGWSSWGTCSNSCGIGIQTSTRTCRSTDTSLSRKCCFGSDTKTQICTLPSCPDAKDCLEVLNQNKISVNGVYKVRSPSSGLVYPVYCDLTNDEGGWTVFQKRFDGSVDFYRTFKEYEDGFGDVNAEFWMGLKRIHDMTTHHETTLRIHLTAADGSTAFQTFQNFSVSPGPDYKLRVGQSTGTAGDRYGLTENNGMRFSTKDKDVDGNSYTDCAEYSHGGWWYSSCGWVNLNGDYVIPGTVSAYGYDAGGVVYYSFKEWQSLKTTSMMFRRK